ncbi:MAG: response regulator [Lachnospiraceae bacterium]|nr:response regulator [Lachnospiraceae bacterium]
MMYKSQIVCIIIILFIAAFYFYSERRTASAKWFSLLLITAVVQLLFDICSVYTVNHLETVSPVLNRIVHCFFMMLMLVLFFIAYKYLEALIEEEKGECIHRIKYAVIPVVIATFSLCFLPIKYIETPKGNYSHGPAVFGVYVCVAASIALIVRLLIKHGKDIPKKKRIAIVIAMLSEAPVAVFQIFVPTSLISCLGITLFIIGLYMTVENPDARLVKLLEKETKRADVANQAKTNFLANMSHEIRTPINAVLGMNEMILRESKERNVKEYARDVQGAAKSLLSIINDILDITKIEAGKLTIIPAEYAFSGMVHDVINMISFKARAKELDFKVIIDEKIPSVLRGDDIRIRQILVNLLNNAVKYTHEGEITLEAGLLPCEQENTALISFVVKDTGIGIKEEDIQKLYIPFERIEEKRNRNIEGTGLGMNITMQLLALLDSKLKVESEYGAGSEFSFVLSQEIMNPEPIGKLGEQIKEQNSEYDYQTYFEAPEARILVVDDNEMNRKVFCSLLKDTKIQIEEASGGKECIEKVKKTSFDIIFMDHMMPEMDGIETFKVMKEMEDYPSKNAPVVILTANAIVGAKEQYLSEGFQAFLSKPIDSQKLDSLIQELLDISLIHYVKADVKKQAVESELKISELPMIDGLDWGYASAHFKDEESMMKTIKLFADSIDYEAKELEKFYSAIHLEEGRKKYRTKVHSMKSSAGIIGIVPLAGMAKVLEDAARNNDCDVIHQMNPIFLKCWRDYKEHLNVFSDVAVGTKSAKEFWEQVEEIFREIKAAAEEMDIDILDASLKKLEEYRFEGEQAETFENVKTAIINLDVDFLESII